MEDEVADVDANMFVDAKIFVEDTAAAGFGAEAAVLVVNEAGASASQTVHLVADFGLNSPHTPQVQVSLLVVGVLPAAAQSKVLTGCGASAVKDAGAADGVEAVVPTLGSSQIVHFLAS
jgi:hypothetical protein